MSIADAFADIALGFSAAFDGPFHDALAKWPGTPVRDGGGSIVTPGTPVEKACWVQVDAVTEAMRNTEGFTQKDMRLLVLRSTLDGAIDTAAKVEVLAGPHAGTWSIDMADTESMGIYWECRGRRLT